MSRSGNVSVAVRVRPTGGGSCITLDRERGKISVRNNDGGLHHFYCDRIFDGEDSQSTLYKESVAPLVTDFIAGRNCCVLVYGEAGSGKSYTVLGPSALTINQRVNATIVAGDETTSGDELSSLGSAGVSRLRGASSGNGSSQLSPPEQILARRGVKHPPQNGNGLRHISEHSNTTEVGGNLRTPLHVMAEKSGIAPRIVKDIYDVFRRRRRRNAEVTDDPKLSFSFINVYDERIVDLLDLGAADNEKDETSSLHVKSTPDQGVYIENAIEVECRQESDVTSAIEVGLATLEKQVANKGDTGNSSHSVFIWKLQRYSKSKGKMATSNFFLLDLANSAMVRKPPTDAPLSFVRECKSVKRSLGALRRCVRYLAFTQKSTTPPYGESVLTKLLHNALVRGSGVSVIVTANPQYQSVPETLSAIRYGMYVAGQKAEESDDAERVPVNDQSKWAIDNSNSLNSRRPSEAIHHTNAINHFRNASGELLSESSYGPTKPPEHSSTYGDLETAGVLLKKLPNEVASDIDSGNKLSHVSTLLKSAAKRIKDELNVTTEAMKSSGFDQSLSAEDMQRQLQAVTEELESLKYDGHLASQIQSDLLAAQEELKRLSVGMDESISPLAKTVSPRNESSLGVYLAKNAIDRDLGVLERDITHTRSGTRVGTSNGLLEQSQSRSHVPTASKEADALRAELAELRITNDLLHQEQAAKVQELAKAREEIQELKLAFLDRPRDRLETQVENVSEPGMDRNEVTDIISSVGPINVIEEKTDDWDENFIEIGPSPVCVCLRLRPMTKLEKNRRSRKCIVLHEGGREFTVESPLDGEYDFCFDHVFDCDSTQEEVYETVGAPIVDYLLGGVNCAVMVYGLSGSGKSHTLAGKLPEMPNDEYNDESSDEESQNSTGAPTEDDAGFSPRLVADLFRGMKDSPNTIEFRITCSYVCIYLEKVFDLLDPRFDKNVVVRDSTNGIHIEGAVEAFCFDEEDIIHLIRRGAACRKLIGTKLTMDPSRSHSILILNIEQHHIRSGRVRRSYLQLVELAGFEVTAKGKGQSMQETKIMHKSFSALGNVIKSLTEGNSYAPYNESKLTSIVKEALGGNCKTTLFITASPSSYHISETINSIRLGQRVRRVTNNPRINIDASIENYRTWLLESETKLAELSSLTTQLAKELVKAAKTDLAVKIAFSAPIWESIEAIADKEECKANPCRKALILDEDDFLEPDQLKWRALTIELAKRFPSEKLQETRTERNRAQSLLSDVQSENVVLKRQNELLVAEKRKMEDELAAAFRENLKLTMQNSELDHFRQIAENRARDGIIFLRYMRTLCWKLRKDVELDRPIDVSDIVCDLQGAPDLSGLVDLDTMMIESGYIYSKDVAIEKMEKEYFDYLQKTGLILDEEQVAAEDEVDELAFLDDGIGTGASDSRWRKAQTKGRVDRIPDTISTGSASAEGLRSASGHETFLGLSLPWLAQRPSEPSYHSIERNHTLRGLRNTRGERELQRDLQNMANKCVELQMQLNDLRQKMTSLTNKSTSLKMKQLTQECLNLAKERDRVMHNAKAATWKLQELHVVNKLLSKQAAESKTQIRYLEEGFQRLQESFRTTVQQGLDTDMSLRDRVKALQSIVDSLTGATLQDMDGDNSDSNSEDENSIGSGNPRLAKIHLPLRGRFRPDPRSLAAAGLIDPSGPLSIRRCLLDKFHQGKRAKKRLSMCIHHKSKFLRRSYQLGTCFMGENRNKLKRAYERGKNLRLPLFLDYDDGYGSEYTDDYFSTSGDDYTH